MQPITLCPHMYACAHPQRCINAIALMWSMLAAHPHRASRLYVQSSALLHTALAAQLANAFLLLSFCPWTQGWASFCGCFWSSWAPVLFGFFADKFHCFCEHVLHLRAAVQICCSAVFKVTYTVSLTITLCCVKWVVSAISFHFISFVPLPKEEYFWGSSSRWN